MNKKEKLISEINTILNNLSKPALKRILQELHRSNKSKEITVKLKAKIEDNIKQKFTSFLNKDGFYPESRVPVSELKYKNKWITKFQHIPGKYVDRATVFLHNKHDIIITRAQQTVGSNPNDFEVIVMKTDNSRLATHKQVDILDLNKIIKSVSKL